MLLEGLWGCIVPQLHGVLGAHIEADQSRDVGSAARCLSFSKAAASASIAPFRIVLTTSASAHILLLRRVVQL